MYDDAVRIRQDLHRIPEIGFQLRDTQAYVLRELRQCSPDRIETLAVCGVKAVFFAKDADDIISCHDAQFGEKRFEHLQVTVVDAVEHYRVNVF